MRIRKTRIAPSIIAIDYKNLDAVSEALEKLKATKVALIHLDVMDGEFVKNKTFDSRFLEQIKDKTDLLLDVHLMVKEPKKVINSYVEAGADIITIHYESEGDIRELLKEIKDKNCLAGLSIKPETPVHKIEPILREGLVDVLLIMAVEPGACGQTFLESTYDKIRSARAISNDFNIQVDGGVNFENAKRIVEAGADILVSGSTIFGSDDYVAAVKRLKN